MTNNSGTILQVAEVELFGDEILEPSAPTEPPSTSSVFTQSSGSDGIVAMEAEHFQNHVSQGGKSWQAGSFSDHSGNGILKALPDTGINNNTGYTTNSPRLDFTVNFAKTGMHYVWIRGYGPLGNDDSIHAGLDGQAVASATRISKWYQRSSLTWVNATMDATRATIQVPTVGEHTLNLWMREDGFVIDKIVLTTNPNYTPSGFGPDETVEVQPETIASPILNTPVPGDTQVDLSWNAVSGTTGYKVYHGTSSGVYGAPTDVGNVTSYTVPNLTNDTTHYFVVVAYDATRESGNSNEESATPVPYNISNYLIAAYDFEEGGGTVVHDISGYQTPADLMIADNQAVTWIQGGLSVDSSTIIKSSSAPQKIMDALQASNEITLEAWVKPANLTQTGPARIVSFSKDTGYRNFTLGQTIDEYRMRLRTTNTTNNGIPEHHWPRQGCSD